MSSHPWHSTKNSGLVHTSRKLLKTHVANREIILYRSDLRGNSAERAVTILRQIEGACPDSSADARTHPLQGGPPMFPDECQPARTEQPRASASPPGLRESRPQVCPRPQSLPGCEGCLATEGSVGVCGIVVSCQNSFSLGALLTDWRVASYGKFYTPLET